MSTGKLEGREGRDGRPPVPKALRKPHDRYEPEILRRAWNQLNVKNEHFMFCIVGREGSGKSYTAIRLAAEIDPTFTPERVIFDVGELLEILNSGEHEPGNAYVLDEAGVSLGKRTWQERSQVLANQALQLIRDHNLALFFTLPRLSELDSQTQGRLHAFYEITKKEPGERVVGKWKYMRPDRAGETGKIYKPYPKVRRDGKVYRIMSLAFAPPSPELTEPYEAAKDEYQSAFYEKVIGELNDESDAEAEKVDVKDVAKEIAADGVGPYVTRHAQTKQPYINADLIRVEYDLSHKDARTVKTLLEQVYGDSELEAVA